MFNLLTCPALKSQSNHEGSLSGLVHSWLKVFGTGVPLPAS